MTTTRFDSVSGPWNPGLQSQIPEPIAHLATLYRPENTFTSRTDARELCDLTGLPPAELVVFRPERLALHEILVRVTANLSVPDGAKIEDLGINFRAMTRTILAQYIEPKIDEIRSAYANARSRLARHVDIELERLMGSPPAAAAPPSTSFVRSLFGVRRKNAAAAPLDAGWDPRLLAGWEARARAGGESEEAAACRALARVVSAVVNRHGVPWGTRELLATLACGMACNTFAGDAIGRILDPLLEDAARVEKYALLPAQKDPVVMNTKGPSAAGKSTLRPLQRALAARVGVDWTEFAVISPDIWRKQLLDYGSLGEEFKYAGAFTGDELAIIDHKLDRYMARKAGTGGTTHLLIDRFRFDSFAPHSDEAGSNLLTRFGHVIYLFFLITPPELLVPRAWYRGQDVGRYKSVDDVLAHSVEAYSGMPGLFFTWATRADKRVHFEFLDNSVAQGEAPRTIAFGWNESLNVLDIGRMLDIERFRRVDVDAKGPESLYPQRELLAPESNAAFLSECVKRFREVLFADTASGRVYARIEAGSVDWVDAAVLASAADNADTRAGLGVAVPGIFEHATAPRSGPVWLRDLIGEQRIHTVGRWGPGEGRA